MAGKEAEDLVFGNLGLTGEDLGADASDELDLGENPGDRPLADDGDEGEQQQQPGRPSDEDDNGRPPAQQQRREDRGRGSRARDQHGRERTHQPKPNEKLSYDAKGNVVTKDGRIVATAGREARLFAEHRTAVNLSRQAGQRVQETEQKLQRAVQIAQQVYGEYEKMQSQQKAIQQLGISPQEQLEALQLVALSKSGPQGQIEVLKKLLTRAAAGGIDLTQLGLNAGGDTKSVLDLVRQTIDERMKPLTDQQRNQAHQQEQRQQKQEVERQALGQVRAFFQQNPEAHDPKYLPVFDAVLKQYPNMTLGEIWAKLQLFEATRRPNVQRQRPMPNGRSHVPNDPGPNGMAPVETSYEQIARDVLNEVTLQRSR